MNDAKAPARPGTDRASRELLPESSESFAVPEVHAGALEAELARPQAHGEALLDLGVDAAELVDDSGPVLAKTRAEVANQRKRQAAVNQIRNRDAPIVSDIVYLRLRHLCQFDRGHVAAPDCELLGPAARKTTV